MSTVVVDTSTNCSEPTMEDNLLLHGRNVLKLDETDLCPQDDGGVSEDTEEEWDSWEGSQNKGRPERWAPLGANDSDKEHSPCGGVEEFSYDPENLKKMKDEQEQLTSALLALTTHFAQVQFRVQQIVVAPPSEKERLLKDLEEFTFRGIPSAVTEKLVPGEEHEPMDELKEKMKAQGEKQKDLITQLKNQLEELELYAYETGEAGLPQKVLLERHKLVIEQLKSALNLNVDELEKLSNEDLKAQVDQAINELVNPLKMKDELVNQLKTQITDLERFIKYLHGEGTWEGATCTCTCNKPTTSANGVNNGTNNNNNGSKVKPFVPSEFQHDEELRAKTIQLMKKALTLLQMFAVSQFGCSSNQFRMNDMKNCPKGNHWGDQRAALEVAISRVYHLAQQSDGTLDGDYTSDCEDAPSIYCNPALTAAVRKELATAIASLLEHGLVNTNTNQSLVPFVSCFSVKGMAGSGFLTAWDLVLRYYRIKNGEKYNSTPARRLSQSFGLEIVGSTAITNKQMLLSAIDNIISSHSRYKRSPESHFKAFVCTGLNSKKLVVWLRLILRCQQLVEQYYMPWSYVAKTGFEDALRSLDRLTSINFDLPVDLAIRQFQNIKDAFQ